jgi:hypothetical protein
MVNYNQPTKEGHNYLKHTRPSSLAWALTCPQAPNNKYIKEIKKNKQNKKCNAWPNPSYCAPLCKVLRLFIVFHLNFS